MKRQSSLLFFLILLSVVIFSAGCSSTPEPEPEVVAPVTESAADAIAEAEAAAAAEAEAAARAAQLAADTARLMAELAAARDTAVAAGADSMFPDEFKRVSDEYEALLKQQQENPDTDLRNQIESLRDTYLAMAKLTQAQEARNRIVDANLQDSDPETFQKGEDAMAQAQSLYNTGAPGFQLIEQATIAYDAYQSILAANYGQLCESQREKALAAKEKADSVKAAMAAKADYGIADGMLSGAEALYGQKDYEGAYNGFVESEKRFTSIYETVFAKRAAAEDAIRRAKQKVDASAAIAAEADEIAPLQDEEDVAAENGTASASEGEMEVVE